MVSALFPVAEADGMAQLQSFAILDTPRELAFDRLVRRAAATLGAPTALISLVDRKQQRFKARIGLDITVTETARDNAFCQHVFVAGKPLVIEDTTRDPQFHDNPLVIGEPGIRFYAGVPLLTMDGTAMGTLCVIDYRPRTISLAELATLIRIAASVTGQFEMRRAVREINAAFAPEHGFSTPSARRLARQTVEPPRA